MNWLLDHLQFVIIIAFAFASWVKHRADAKNAEAEERRAREEMANDESVFEPGEWEIPTFSPAPSVPPPLARQAVPPSMRVDVSEADAILKRQQEIQERLRQIQQTKATTTGNAAATRARIAAAGKPAQPSQAGKTSLRASLRDAKQTRRAIVLREILGPPVGLR